MTESEKIVQSGLISEDFLKEEVRCGFLVTEQLKKVWAVELDLLAKFDAVCKKYNLRYFMMWGSLIGAVRHKGFVPWDDDMDIGMPREDYDKLINVIDEEFSYPYFFQTPYTDKGSNFSMPKLRNSNTTAMIRAFRYETFNQGIVFDIFPMDNCVLEDAEERYNAIKKLIISGSAHMRRNNPNPTEKDIEMLKQYNPMEPIDNNRKLHEIWTMYNDIETEYYASFTSTTYSWNRHVFKKEDFEEVIYCDFEGFKVPIPRGYDRILKTSYGNYMDYPPVEERGNWHTQNIFYDPDRPYTYYLDNKEEII